MVLSDGVPHILNDDRPEICSTCFSTKCLPLKIMDMTTMTCFAQMNGIIERFNLTFMAIIPNYEAKHQKYLELYALQLTNAYKA